MLEFQNISQGNKSPIYKTFQAWNLASDYLRKLEKKNLHVKRHSERVAKLSFEIAKTLGLSQKEIRDAEMAGALHDIGKIHISKKILDKPFGLSAKETQTIQEIPQYSASIAEFLGLSPRVQKALAQQHERLDGRGYPHGLLGWEISKLAKIIAVADAFDSLINDQPFRVACTEGEAIGLIRSCSNIRFEPEIVDALTIRILTTPKISN